MAGVPEHIASFSAIRGDDSSSVEHSRCPKRRRQQPSSTCGAGGPLRRSGAHHPWRPDTPPDASRRRRTPSRQWRWLRGG
ncbi:hypothetical protein GUJ93_ZPchr0013g37379 [Zizania palustris]|uniref:Uncharacterized protein n=1 Tax=Zizania palustris TaxID=103762 RepID=A0A8J6C2A8_ZIZPA|nr:hypothetical protein GUJ93_ZPchr0013g37379 [Zizania palustris]